MMSAANINPSRFVPPPLRFAADTGNRTKYIEPPAGLTPSERDAYTLAMPYLSERDFGVLGAQLSALWKQTWGALKSLVAGISMKNRE